MQSATATATSPSRFAWSDLRIPVAVALVRILLHLATDGRYGFHRDELQTVDDARYLAWGYVAYPPLTPFVARVAFELFGASLTGLRFFAALGQGVALVLIGLLVRDLGGKRTAQLAAALGVAIAPLSLSAGTLFQYVSFDYLWWVLTAYFMVRLLRTENPRWWLGIGAAIGLGMLTKYTVLFLVAGMAAGVLLTPARRYLRSPWLWCGAVLAVLIFLPNLIWQFQHDFISLDFLRSIHERDVRIGRTKGFLVEQLYVPANPFTIPMWLTGLYYVFTRRARRYRPFGWMFITALALFLVAQGRSYYMAPAYPALLAAGAVFWEQRLAAMTPAQARWRKALRWTALTAGAVLAIVLVVQITPINSPLWNISDDRKEEIGWPELVQAVAGVRDGLPAEDRKRLGVLTGNYGEAGAIDLYGPPYSLPRAISGVNSYWLRGYGDPPPETVIAVGLSRRSLDRVFESCELAGHVTNRYNVKNEETTSHPDIFLCRRPRQPWPELWKQARAFG